MGLSEALQFIFSGLTSGSIYAMVALGFTMIFNTTDVVNFAQGEFVMLGGMFAVTLHRFLGWPLTASVAGAILLTVLVGIVIERLTIAPVRRASVLSFVMITLGWSVMIKQGALLTWGTNFYILESFSPGQLRVGGAVLGAQVLWVLGVTGLLVVGHYFFYKRTMLGQAMLATAIDPERAALVGINISRMRIFAFMGSAGLGALGGVLLVPIASSRYDLGFGMAVKGFAAAAIGGLGNSTGAIIGGLSLGLLEALSVGFISSGYKDFVALAVFLLVLLLYPSGLLGGREERRHTAAR